MSAYRRTSEIAEREARNKVYGVVIGIVSDNVDPAGTHRVRVRFPWLPNTMEGDKIQEQSYWCRLATLMGGDQKGGFFCLPEPEDEVLVAFEHGDMARGYVLGSLWSAVAPSATPSKDEPIHRPVYNNTKACGHSQCSNPKECGFVNAQDKFVGKHEAKMNDLRLLRSRSGHELIFNDNATEARVVLHSGGPPHAPKKEGDSSGKSSGSSSKGQSAPAKQPGHRIVLDDQADPCIEIYDGKEENYIRIDTNGPKQSGKQKGGGKDQGPSFRISIESKTGSIHIKAKDTIALEAETITTLSRKDTIMTAKGKFSLEATDKATLTVTNGDMFLKASPNIHLNEN